MNLFNNSELFKPTFLRVIWFSSKMTLSRLIPDVILFLLHNPRNYRMLPNSPLNHKESASISDKILMIQSVTHSLTKRPFLFQFDSNKRRTHLRRTIPKSTVEEGRRQTCTGEKCRMEYSACKKWMEQRKNVPNKVSLLFNSKCVPLQPITPWIQCIHSNIFGVEGEFCEIYCGCFNGSLLY